MTGLLHPAARDLLLLAVDHGWDAIVSHGVDTGGAPYVTVRAQRPDPERYIDVTWHTRDTGTYRLFHCLVGRSRHSVRDAPLKTARALVDGSASSP